MAIIPFSTDGKHFHLQMFRLISLLSITALPFNKSCSHLQHFLYLINFYSIFSFLNIDILSFLFFKLIQANCVRILSNSIWFSFQSFASKFKCIDNVNLAFLISCSVCLWTLTLSPLTHKLTQGVNYNWRERCTRCIPHKT